MKKSFKTFFIIPTFIFTFIVLMISCKKNDEPVNLTDIEGNIYKIITINKQTWMAENLKTTKLNDGTSIPNTKPSNSSWDWYHNKTFAYCWFNNDSTNKEVYGALYNWYTISTAKLCPKGWHVPSEFDLDALVTFIGGYAGTAGKLKETGTTHWNSPNSDATNETGFTALPAGFTTSGYFFGFGNKTLIWSSTETDVDNAYEWSMSNYDYLAKEVVSKEFGGSVRCIKD
jgi:uncharacterized protein (TIGR02145 family)